MSITILNYHDQALIDQINAQAAERAAAKKASSAADGDFSSTLDEASRTYASENLTLTDCSADLNSIFEEAASTFGVSVNLLKSITRPEQKFQSERSKPRRRGRHHAAYACDRRFSGCFQFLRPKGKYHGRRETDFPALKQI